MAMKICHAFEDCLYEKEKMKVFNELFDRYLSLVDIDGKMEPYDAICALGRSHRPEYDTLIHKLREHRLISD
jgi:hypothetical protein